jgi:hypothetical protein
MVINFKYGFEYKGFSFGWSNKELYRLPTVTKKNSYYQLKKLSKICINGKVGYRVSLDKKTIIQLKELTEIINYTYIINGYQSPDTPF